MQAERFMKERFQMFVGAFQVGKKPHFVLFVVPDHIVYTGGRRDLLLQALDDLLLERFLFILGQKVPLQGLGAPGRFSGQMLLQQFGRNRLFVHTK